MSLSPPDYVVLRPAPDLPAGFLPEYWDGLWIDYSVLLPNLHVQIDGAVAVPSGRFEQRDDGAVAEVYEVRP